MALPIETERALRIFYSDGGESDITGKRVVRCVVLGTANPDWHHLDDNHANNDIGNIIPLASPLNQYLGGKKRRRSVGVPALFDVRLQTPYLLNIANTHLAEWRFGRAIGCFRLAYYLTRPPYPEIEDNLRLEIACAPIRHLRHHVNPAILHTTLRDVQSILARRRSAPAKILASLEYDLVALLNEHGEREFASDCADVMITFWPKNLEKTLPLEKLGSIKRRIYQVALLGKTSVSALDLRAELEEMEESPTGYPLKVSRSNTDVLAALQKGDQKSLRRAYDRITSLCEDFDPLLEKGRKPGVGPSDLAEIYLYRSVLARLVKPSQHPEIVRTSCDRSSGLFGECHALITNQYPDFWDSVLRHLALTPDSKHPLAQLIKEKRRSDLPPATALLMRELFTQAKRTIAVN